MSELKRSVVLWADGDAVERIDVEARPLEPFERSESTDVRFKEDLWVASIQWVSGIDKRGSQSTRLRPMNAIELRAFGVKCIELAGEMEAVENERKQREKSSKPG